jgi:hypothetical protein
MGDRRMTRMTSATLTDCRIQSQPVFLPAWRPPFDARHRTLGIRLASVRLQSKENSMTQARKVCLAMLCMAGMLSAQAAHAGCMTGAAVGGVAGHVAGHHGVIGAAGGCAVGHHQAKKKAQAASGAPAAQ